MEAYKEFTNQCTKCGGEMIGDGYTLVEHCENAEESTYEYHEPDASPVYCDFEDAKPSCFNDVNASYGGECYYSKCKHHCRDEPICCAPYAI